MGVARIPNMTTYTKGQRVYFGRTHGEKTLGRVVKVNRVTCQVEQLEARGTYKAHSVGSKWKVPFRLLSPADDGPPPLVPPRAPVEPQGTRSEAEIMSDVRRCYGNLSPENLHCDGEISVSAARRKERVLNRELKSLFRELGREVDEMAAYRYGRPGY